MSPVGVATSRSSQALETGVAKLWILLVGVNHYQDPQFPTLRYSALDCQGLGEALQEATQGFPQKEVRIHHDFAPQLPQLETVYSSLKQITTAAKPQDTVLFYFSGHGMLEPSSQQAVLCLTDTQKDDLLGTGLGLQTLLQLLGNCAAHQQLVWLDACHSGGMTLKGARGKTTAEPFVNPMPQLVEVLRQRAQKSKGFYALLSCDQGQQSWEFPELGHGVFTYYLMRGLRGEAADSQGVIEADGLYRYVYYQTLQYIDKTNQQLRLINQQSSNRGENRLHSEYPLQTPKRIVEGVGELILGLKSAEVASQYPRQALVIEGLASNQTTLDLSKMLRSAGHFELQYWPRSESADVREVMQTALGSQKGEACNFSSGQSEATATVLLYLRGRIEETEAGEPGLVCGEEIRLSRSWLRQQLRHTRYAQQIVILDCPGASSLADWIEDLQLGPEQGQCLIAAAASPTEPERFAQVLLDTLRTADDIAGLTVAGWITQLQLTMAGSGIPLYVWLSGAQGVIEVLPGNTHASRGSELTTGFDLGLCPYQGLKAFGEEDTQYFYGRETLTQQLIQELGQRPFLAVVGASGSGKSSVVQAGLIAQLRKGKQLPGSQQWWIRSFRPSSQPLAALAKRLVDFGTEKEKAYQQLQLEGFLYQGVEGFVYWMRSRPEPMIVLVIDQFEELFTLTSAEERQRFLAIVLGAVKYAGDRFKLIITLRADFIAPCLEVPVLAQALQQSSVLVPPCLSEDDYRRVIVKPAEQVGLKVEPELVEILLQELYGHHPAPAAGDLPLLEFVLEQLWEHRQAGELTLQAYLEQIGGLKGALERKAQAVYDSLDPDAQRCAQWLFLSLTQLGEGTEDTRRRVLKSDLVVEKYPAALVQRTLQALTTAKLVVVNWEEETVGSRGSDSPEPLQGCVTVEVAHEILIRHWSTLRWWLEENRARLRSQRQIEQAAHLWHQSGQQSDFLLRGVRLAEAEDIYIKYTDELPKEVQTFIEACLAEQQQQQFQVKKRLRRAQLTAAVMIALGIIASGFGGLAYVQGRKASLSEIEALDSLSSALLLSNQQLEALIASLKAGQKLKRLGNAAALHQSGDISSKTVMALSQAIYETQELNRFNGHQSWVTSVSFSPNGELIASGSSDNTVKLWQRDGSFLKTLTGHQKSVNSVSFSRDGELIASASSDKTIKLWTREGTLLKTLQGQSSFNSVSFSRDILASGSSDNTIKLWSRDGKLLKTLSGHRGSVHSVSFSPDNQILASGSDDNTVKLWSRDGTLLKTLQGHTRGVESVSFSPDGSLIASASDDNTVKLWSRDGQLLKTLLGHTRGIHSVSFSADSQTLASASDDTTVKLWSRDGTLLKTLTGHHHGVNQVSFSPDNQTLASASDDNTVKLWSREQILPKTLFGHEDEVTSVSFSSDGQAIASSSQDHTIKLWTREGTLLKTLSGHSSEVTSISFSPDNRTIASASADNTIKLWTRNGTFLKTLSGHTSWVSSISFSPDNQLIASGSADNTIKLWTRDGILLKTLPGHTSWVTSVRFSPDGQMIASGSADNTIKLWNRDGTLLKTLPGHRSSVWSVNFSPNGKIIASASQDGTIILWHRDGTLLKSFQAHMNEVNSVSFSPDGKNFASASDDSTIKLWNLDGTLLKTLPGHHGNVRSVSFSPDGKLLVAANADKTVNLWRLDGMKMQTLELNLLIQYGCDRLHNYLKTNPTVKESDRHVCDRL